MLQGPKDQPRVAAALFRGQCVLPLAAAPTSTTTHSCDARTLFKTRVWGSKHKNVHCSSATAPVKTELRWGCEESRKKTAVGSGVSFKYDPFGRRIYKLSSTATSVYAYDGDNIIEETNASGAVVARYSQGLNIDEPLAMSRSSATSFYNADGLGSITSLANAAGALAQTYTFDSFGKQTASTGSLTNPFQYTGRESDSETGLYYYRARYCDPTIGRFLREDPRKFKGGIDFYAYVSNQPLNLVDPYGLWPSLGDLGKALKQGKGAWDKAKGYAGQIGCQISYWYCITTTFDNLDSLSQAKQGMPRPTEDELAHPSDNLGASQGAKQLHDCIAGNPNCKKALDDCLLGVWAGGILPH
jgi:RHS repeat-associated protein